MDIIVLIYIAVFIIGAILNIVIGGIIGKAKGREGTGQLLGLLTGPLGWLIVALLPVATQQAVHRRTVSAHASRGTPCQMCGQLIPQGNVTCPQCHS